MRGFSKASSLAIPLASTADFGRADEVHILGNSECWKHFDINEGKKLFGWRRPNDFTGNVIFIECDRLCRRYVSKSLSVCCPFTYF